MIHVSYTQFRDNLARHMDAAAETRVPLLVTRQGGKGNVVVLSEEEFVGWQETVHLLSSSANAARLRRSIREANAGQVVEQSLVAPATK